jgi:nitrilase
VRAPSACTNQIIGCQSLSQTYAVESAAFVLHCTSVFMQKGIDAMNTAGGALFNTPGGGCSAVFGPDGRRLTKEVDSKTEEILYADLDMDLILAARCFVDACGHYSRPDLLWLGVDDREKRHRVKENMEENENQGKKELVNGTNEAEKARKP